MSIPDLSAVFAPAKGVEVAAVQVHGAQFQGRIGDCAGDAGGRVDKRHFKCYHPVRKPRLTWLDFLPETWGYRVLFP